VLRLKQLILWKELTTTLRGGGSVPKNFSSSLTMLMIGSLFVTLTLVTDMPEVFLWFFIILSLPLNILGIVGVIVHSWIQKNEI